jgi:hypothetical protein
MIQAEMSKELLQRFDVMAAKLGVTIDQLWAVLARQGMIDGVLGVIMVIAGVVCGFICYKFCLRLFTADPCNMSAGTEIVLPMLIATSLICCIAFICEGVTAACYLINPEYFAIAKMIELLN